MELLIYFQEVSISGLEMRLGQLCGASHWRLGFLRNNLFFLLELLPPA